MLVGCGESVENNRIDSIEYPISTSISTLTEDPISTSDSTLTENPIRTSASTLTAIYTNVTDDSGILNLYSVTDGEQTKYIVDYKDVSYLVESDYSYLSIDLFEKYQTANLKINNLKIECAHSFVTNVNETTYYNDDEFEKTTYDIIQGKDGTRYSAELSFDNEEYRNTFTLNNEKGDNLLILSADASGYSEDIAVFFLDVKMDGYIDIQFLEEGTMNNSYALYVWNDSTKNFYKVKLEEIEMLSYIEVYDGYLKNWLRDSGNSGVIQILVWKDKNTLIKESEESYEAD